MVAPRGGIRACWAVGSWLLPLLLPSAAPPPTPPSPGWPTCGERHRGHGASEHASRSQLCRRSGLRKARRLQSGAGWRGSGSPEGSPLTYFHVLQSCQEVCGGTESKHRRGLQSETARDLLEPRAGAMVNFPTAPRGLARTHKKVRIGVSLGTSLYFMPFCRAVQTRPKRAGVV